MRTPPADGPIVLGILYPGLWQRGSPPLGAVVAGLRALDDRIEVAVETYDLSLIHI